MSEAKLSAAEFLRSLALEQDSEDNERLHAIATAIEDVLESGTWWAEHQHVGDVAPSIALRFDLSSLKAV
jgi:hypothetical protein